MLETVVPVSVQSWLSVPDTSLYFPPGLHSVSSSVHQILWTLTKTFQMKTVIFASHPSWEFELMGISSSMEEHISLAERFSCNQSRSMFCMTKDDSSAVLTAKEREQTFLFCFFSMRKVHLPDQASLLLLQPVWHLVSPALAGPAVLN